MAPSFLCTSFYLNILFARPIVLLLKWQLPIRVSRPLSKWRIWRPAHVPIFIDMHPDFKQFRTFDPACAAPAADAPWA